MKRYPALKILLLFLILTSAGGKMKELSFEEFRDFLKNENISECEVTFDGKETAAPVTGNKYLFLQIITYCGDDDITSSYRTWNTDDEFYLVYKNLRVKLSRTKVRTFIEKTGSFEEMEEGRMFPSDEFGLVKGKKYFVRFSVEEYHLPPDRESGRPQKKINHVLWISNKTFINTMPQIKLTPMYERWSY